MLLEGNGVERNDVARVAKHWVTCAAWDLGTGDTFIGRLLADECYWKATAKKLAGGQRYERR